MECAGGSDDGAARGAGAACPGRGGSDDGDDGAARGAGAACPGRGGNDDGAGRGVGGGVSSSGVRNDASSTIGIGLSSLEFPMMNSPQAST